MLMDINHHSQTRKNSLSHIFAKFDANLAWENFNQSDLICFSQKSFK